jgi:SAM-dependent methyltransferase
MRPALQRPYEAALKVRPLVMAAQFAVTGERVPRRHRLLAEEVRRGAHDFVLDLGCGQAEILRYVEPRRYVGIDEHDASLAMARRRYARAGVEFVQATLDGLSLAPWRGADVVTVASVTHHLADSDVAALMARINDTVAPGRILVQDAEPIGRLGPLVTALDDGDHLRTRDELVSILESDFDVQRLWTYDNPLRSFHQFLLELRPADGGDAAR